MRGLRATSRLAEAARRRAGAEGSARRHAMRLLDEEGLTSVVATNCEQHYGRPLVIGDRLLVRSSSSRSPIPSAPASGRAASSPPGSSSPPFPTPTCPRAPSPTEIAALAEAGDPVATMRFRILKFLPPAAPAPAARVAAERPTLAPAAGHHPGQRLLVRGRPGPQAAHPALRLVRHPAPPAPAGLRRLPSLEWDTVEASGRGTSTRSWWCTIPRCRRSTTRCPSGLVELEEGTRVVANLDGIARESCRSACRWWRRSSTTTTSSPCPCSSRPDVGSGGVSLMDFTFTEEQEAVAEAAAGLLRGHGHPGPGGRDRAHRRPRRPRAVGGPGPADLLGLAVPEAYGGSGYGLTELCLFLEAAGQRRGPVPLWATLVLGALPLAASGLARAEGPLAARRGVRERSAHRGADRGGANSVTGPAAVDRRPTGRLGLNGTSSPCPRPTWPPGSRPGPHRRGSSGPRRSAGPGVRSSGR
jgi:hypothetical protein